MASTVHSRQGRRNDRCRFELKVLRHFLLTNICKYFVYFFFILMNAIIILNHFCEIHGPQTIFSTQTLRDRSLLNNSNSSNNNNGMSSTSSGWSVSATVACEACSSIGNIVFLSQDKDSSIMFVSSEKSVFGKEHQNSLKETALKSLCEVIDRFL